VQAIEPNLRTRAIGVQIDRPHALAIDQVLKADVIEVIEDPLT
jgi:hypothetical protein